MLAKAQLKLVLSAIKTPDFPYDKSNNSFNNNTHNNVCESVCIFAFLPRKKITT